MRSPTGLYDLLSAYAWHYGDEDLPLAEFCAAWCEGVDAAEAARRLGEAPGSPAECDLKNVVDAESGNVVLIGPLGSWTLVFQIGGYESSSKGLLALSRDSGRALSLSWDINGGESLNYAVNGELVTVLTVTDPQLRFGTDPDALDPYMDGLRFQLGTGRDGVQIEESITSALRLIGRVTGREIDREWLDSTHALYALPD